MQYSNCVHFAHFAPFEWLLNNILLQNNFHTQDIPNSKNISRNMQGINSISCRHWFEKLEILNIPSLYIYQLTLFAVDNLHNFQTNSSLHNINTIYNNQLHVPSVTLSAIQMYYLCAVRIFNKLPIRIAKLKNDKTVFHSDLRKYLLTNFVFYRTIVNKLLAVVYFEKCLIFISSLSPVHLLYWLLFKLLYS